MAITIAVAMAIVAYADAQGSGDEQTAAASAIDADSPLARSPRASEVEGEITRTDLGGRVEDALGDAFAGVWFEPSTAEVNVGVVSPAGARLAEAAAAEVNLSGLVTEIPVESTWSALDAAQQNWNHRLDDLLRRGEAATALIAHRNAVTVELASSVSLARRAALEQAAAADSVKVLVESLAYRTLSAEPIARCEAFKTEGEAFCDPTIAGGVTIHGPWVKPKKGGGGEEEESEIEAEPGQEETEEVGVKTVRSACTAGPAAIKANPADKEDATNIYVLTAGHCIDENLNGGGLSGKWTAYNKMGLAKGGNELGEATAFIFELLDIGAIKVKKGYWAKANTPNPVTPSVARLDATESDPLPVIDERIPMEKTKTCMSGQISGRECGEIIALNKKMKVKGVMLESLIEAKKISPIAGDSGAPMYAEDKYKEGTAYVEGVAIARNLGNDNLLFHSLGTSFFGLNIKGLKLELLTKKNERRHPVVTADKYPTTVTAKDATASDQLKAFGATITCAESEFDGALTSSEPEATALELTPLYKECTADGETLAKFTYNECKYKLTLDEKVEEDHYKAEAGIVCPEGKPGIQIHIYSGHGAYTAEKKLCTFTMPPQSGLKSVTATNSSGKIVIDQGTIEGLKVQVDVENCLCVYDSSGTETTSGVYHIEEPLTLSGSSGVEAVDIDLAGGYP